MVSLALYCVASFPLYASVCARTRTTSRERDLDEWLARWGAREQERSSEDKRARDEKEDTRG